MISECRRGILLLMSDLFSELDKQCRGAHLDLFPRNVQLLCLEVIAAWKSKPLSHRTEASVGRLRSRLRSLKTDHAIRRWLYEQAPIRQLVLAQHASACVGIALWEHRDDPIFLKRMKLKLRAWKGRSGRRYHD